MADLRFAGMAMYAVIFYTLLQLSVAPNGENQMSPQSEDLSMEDFQMDADKLIPKSNPRRLRATEEDKVGMRGRDKKERSPSDVRLRLHAGADDSAREEKAGSEFRTDHRTEGEYSQTRRERDPATGIQSRGDAPSNRGRAVIGNQAKYAGDSSTSISCASGFKNNCQPTRSKVNKTRRKLERGVGDTNTRRGDARPASIGLVGKMNALKSGTARFSDHGDPSWRMAKDNRAQPRSNYILNDPYSEKVLSNRGNKSSKEMRHDSGESDQLNGDYKLFRDGIFWSESAEKLLPNRTSEAIIRAWRNDIRSHRVVRLLPGCGRDSNRLAVLENGERLCCRYRQNVDQIQGEILSFHLSRLIGIENLPLGVLMRIEPDIEQWEAVKENITSAGWEQGRIIVATKWIPDLEPAFIPTELKGMNETLRQETIDKSDLMHLMKNHNHLVELIQWSDLAIFDYVTANLDRIVNSLVNLQWNRYMLKQPVHNLEVSRTDRRLWFLDNESGLRHGYRMLNQYGHYHDQILKSLCLFRTQTVQRLKTLSENANFWELLISAVESDEPLFKSLPSYPPKFRDVLKTRMKNVVEHSDHCKQKH
ncbi:four-jointed box protein 1 [Strongylocentrotus purpuratus]|uniref:Four-jointed n=1 Tax=Strongylocentrotus purpuratus TaxID=7668 RepID=A0A7M7HEB9_STRPU|nr:four-jointed box protein 1 [Strongylocentrotus purpuratus]